VATAAVVAAAVGVAVAAAVGVAVAAVEVAAELAVDAAAVDAAVEARLTGTVVPVVVVDVVADVGVADVVSEVVDAVLAVWTAPADRATASTPAPATELVAIAALTALTRRRPRVRCSDVMFVMQGASWPPIMPGWTLPERCPSLCHFTWGSQPLRLRTTFSAPVSLARAKTS
jgi:hypothetical protein